MTHIWVLTGFWLLLAALLLRALPRLGAVLLQSRTNTFAALALAAFFAIPLMFYWGIVGIPAAILLAFVASTAVLDPTVAFGAYMAIMIFRPWELWSSDDIFRLFPRLGALWIGAFAIFLFFRDRRPRFLKASLALLAFFAWCLLTAFVTPEAGSTSMAVISALLPAGILFFLLQFWIQTEDDQFLLEDFLAISLTGAALLSLFLYFDGSSEERFMALGIFSNSNDVAALCVMALPLALRPWLRQRRTSISAKVFSLVMAVPLLAAILLAQSRGALLALGTMLAVAVLVRTKSKARVIATVAILIAFAFAAPLLDRESDDLDQSTSSRLAYWKAGAKMALHHPIAGVGWGRFPSEFENYSTTHLYEFGHRTAHSSWILVLAETGWFGLALFAGIWIFAFKTLWPLRQQHPEVLLALVGYATTMTFLSHTFLFYPYLLLGLTFAVIRMHTTKSTRPA